MNGRCSNGTARVSRIALTAEAYPEDALSDELSSHRQTQMDTNKIKFPDVLITYHDEDILAVEVEK